VKKSEEARRQFIRGLRAVAGFYECNPDAYYDGMAVSLNMYVGGPAAGETLAVMADVFGECEQMRWQNHISVAKNFSQSVRVEVFARAPESPAAKPLLLP
jgi:hypothetical protein